MATEEDNFDIDIYGEGDGADTYTGAVKPQDSSATEQHTAAQGQDASASASNGTGLGSGSQTGQTINPAHLPPQPHGFKRERLNDDRPTDPGATAALSVSELPWWITDDEIRGWANQSQCEDELVDITFSEHKVNGKSKGQVYLLTSSPQAATAIKHMIDSFVGSGRYKQRLAASYTNPHNNPFKTLPKDQNTRNNSNQGNRSASGAYNSGAGPGAGGQGNTFNQSGYRGGRGGGFNNRGGSPNMGGSYGRGGMMAGGAYQGAAPMTGFQGNVGGAMGGYGGGFQGRGGMMNNNAMRGNPMGMRGGRGGMNNNMMGMPMGGMPMAATPMPFIPQMNPQMAMPGMQAAYQPQAYYPQQGEPTWNPHGAKRTRQE